MPDAPAVPPASQPRSDFNNWISAIGGVIATGALFSFAAAACVAPLVHGKKRQTLYSS